MADDEDQSTTDSQDEGLTREQKAVALGLTLQGLDALERQVSSGRLPTQAAPVAPPVAPPMTGTQPAPVAPVVPPQQPPVEPPRNRMFMGPNIGGPTNPQEFFGDLSPNRLIMPPAMRNPGPLPPQAQAAMQARLAAGTGAESDPAALSRLQAADRPGSRTIDVRSESPTSDASLANQRNQMLYNAMKKFDAGDRSPEVQALILGKAAQRPMSAFQQVSSIQRQQQLDQQKARADKGVAVKTDALTALNAKSLFNEKAMLMGQINSPNTNPKKVPELKSQLDAVNARIKEIVPTSPGATTATGNAASPPVQAPAPQGRPVKDKSGKTWLYTGSAKDPKTDKDPSHWMAQ